MQQFHFNNNYNNDSANHVGVFLSRPLDVELTTFINSYGHDTYGWPRLYNNEFSFSTIYQTLSVGKQVPKFHLQYALLYYIGHLCVPSCDCRKIIWEAHYSHVERCFYVEKIVEVIYNYFYCSKLGYDIN
jgi:hypothetical protein